jgi:hypothetical protein
MTSERVVVDWRGKRIPRYAPPVRPRVNPATGRPICVVCATPLDGMSATARFCCHGCRSRYHARLSRAAG